MNFSPPLIWFLIGVFFLITELFVPGFILIFFTAGSWLVALLTWQLEINLTLQVIIFMVSSILLLLALRKYSLDTFQGKTRDMEDDDYTDSKIGKSAVVTQDISPSIPGEIKVMGSFWRATAEVDIKEGQPVTIVSQESEDGLTFKVKLKEGGEHE
jgi:membrane protein implicated in regulation of membrane protease activity